MKKIIILIVGVLILLLVIWMGYKSTQRLDKKVYVEDAQNDLSQMLKLFDRTDIQIAPKTILIYFNSECEHCQWEIKEVSKNIDQFEKHQLLLASFEPEDEAITFLNKHNLSNFYLKSSPENVMSAFTAGVPQTLVYQDGELIKRFKGDVKVENILDALN